MRKFLRGRRVYEQPSTKSLRPTPEMYVKSGIALTGLLISCLHFLGLSSYRWDRRSQKVGEIVNPLRKCIRFLIYMTTTLLRMSLMGLFVLNLKNIDLKVLEDFVQFVVAAIAFLTFVFDLHTIFKFQEMGVMLNTLHLYQTTFADKYGRQGRIRQRMLSEKVVYAIMFGLVGVVLISPLAYLICPKCHHFSPLLQLVIKDEPDSFLWTISMLAIELVFSFCLVSSLVVQTVMAVPLTLFAIQIGLQLRIPEGKGWTIPALREIPGRLSTHRSVQIMINQFREVIGNSLYPFVILFLMCALVFINVVLIRIEFPLIVQLGIVIVEIIVLIYLYCYVQVPAMVVNILNSQLKVIDKAVGIPKVRQSLRPIVVPIGNFHKVKNTTCLRVSHHIFDFTVSMLILLS